MVRRRDRRAPPRWRDVPGYEEYYEVSDRGEVRTVGFYHKGWLRRLNPPRMVKATPRTARSRLRCVTLTVDGNRYTESVGQLVLLAFVGEPPEGQEHVRRKNGDMGDDNLWNLEWASKATVDWQSRVLEGAA